MGGGACPLKFSPGRLSCSPVLLYSSTPLHPTSLCSQKGPQGVEEALGGEGSTAVSGRLLHPQLSSRWDPPVARAFRPTTGWVPSGLSFHSLRQNCVAPQATSFFSSLSISQLTFSSQWQQQLGELEDLRYIFPFLILRSDRKDTKVLVSLNFWKPLWAHSLAHWPQRVQLRRSLTRA